MLLSENMFYCWSIILLLSGSGTLEFFFLNPFQSPYPSSSHHSQRSNMFGIWKSACVFVSMADDIYCCLLRTWSWRGPSSAPSRSTRPESSTLEASGTISQQKSSPRLDISQDALRSISISHLPLTHSLSLIH